MKNQSALVAMAMGNFIIGIGSFIVAGVIQPIATDYSVSLEAAGFLITFYALAYAIGSPLLIWLTGKMDRRHLLLGGLILALIGNALAAIAPTYGFMIAARIIQALGAAVFTPTASTAASLLTKPEERGKAISIVFAGFASATALGLPLGTYVGLTFGWRITFGVVAFLALIAIIANYIWVPAQIIAPPADLAIFKKILADRSLTLMLLITSTQVASQIILFTFVTPYIELKTALGAAGITFMFLANGVAGFFGNLWGGNLTDRIGARKTTLLFLLLLLGAFLLFPLIETAVWIGAVSIAVWGLVGIGFNAAQQARLVTAAPHFSSAILGLNASFLYFGITIGSILGGFIVNRDGLAQLPAFAAGITLLSILIFYGTYQVENRIGIS